MEDCKFKPKRRWWNNGWIGLAILLVLYILLFITGKNSLQSELNPLVEGRQLSEWTDELLDHDSFFSDEHNRASEVLRRHQQELCAVLVRWLDTRDTFPQHLYFFTISRYRGNPTFYLRDDLGAYSWQFRAAKAARVFRMKDPLLAAALGRNLEHYRVQNDFKKGRNELAEVVENSLRTQTD